MNEMQNIPKKLHKFFKPDALKLALVLILLVLSLPGMISMLPFNIDVPRVFLDPPVATLLSVLLFVPLVACSYSCPGMFGASSNEVVIAATMYSLYHILWWYLLACLFAKLQTIYKTYVSR